MKRIFLIIVVACLFASQDAMAGLTCVDSGQITPRRSGNTLQVVTCTFDTTPGTAVATIPMTVMEAIDDAYCWIDIVPASAGPTDDSDLQIVDSRSLTIVSATGNGADVLDEATSTFGIMGEGDAGNSMFIHAHAAYQWTVTVTNNAVNNSEFIMFIEAVH